MPMETIAQALERLAARGYLDDFRAEHAGLRSQRTGVIHAPEEFQVDEVVRFEGESDPADEAAVFALRAGADAKGTYTVAYGPEMDPLDVEMVRRLRR